MARLSLKWLLPASRLFSTWLDDPSTPSSAPLTLPVTLNRPLLPLAPGFLQLLSAAWLLQIKPITNLFNPFPQKITLSHLALEDRDNRPATNWLIFDIFDIRPTSPKKQ